MPFILSQVVKRTRGVVSDYIPFSRHLSTTELIHNKGFECWRASINNHSKCDGFPRELDLGIFLAVSFDLSGQIVDGEFQHILPIRPESDKGREE